MLENIRLFNIYLYNLRGFGMVPMTTTDRLGFVYCFFGEFIVKTKFKTNLALIVACFMGASFSSFAGTSWAGKSYLYVRDPLFEHGGDATDIHEIPMNKWREQMKIKRGSGYYVGYFSVKK